jgi:hypothetical protein
VRLAARGVRDLDGGEEPIGEAFMRTELKRQAWRIHIESLLLGAALTGLALLIPA